jgi:hypothetical protein
LDLRGRKWREAEEDCIMRSFTTCKLHQIRMNKSRRKRLAGKVVRMRNLKGRHHSEDLGVDGRKILEWFLKETDLEDVDWIHLA